MTDFVFPDVCPCGFPVTPASGAQLFSAQWWIEHKAHHLRAYPHLAERDPRSIRNLDDVIRDAAGRC